MKKNNRDFEEKSQEIEEETTSLVQVEDMTTDEIQLTEQLYYSAGLDPIVEAGIRDYDRKIEQENKLSTNNAPSQKNHSVCRSWPPMMEISPQLLSEKCMA